MIECKNKADEQYLKHCHDILKYDILKYDISKYDFEFNYCILENNNDSICREIILRATDDYRTSYGYKIEHLEKIKEEYDVLWYATDYLSCIMNILNKEKPLLDLNEYYVIELKLKDDYNRYFKYHITKEEIQEGK